MLKSTRYLGEVDKLDDNRYFVVERLSRDNTQDDIIHDTNLCRALLYADPYIQKIIETRFKKSYYDFVLQDLTKNKDLWKTDAYLSTRDFFVILQSVHKSDRLIFIKNIGHENIHHLKELWQIESAAKCLTEGDAKALLYADFLKAKFPISDMLGVLASLKHSVSEQWQYVQYYLGEARAREILTVLDNNELCWQGKILITYGKVSPELREEILEPVSLQALKCQTTTQLVALLKDKTASQQRLIVELFGGPKEIKRTLDHENYQKGYPFKKPPNDYVSFGKFLRSLPMDTRLDLIGFPTAEDANEHVSHTFSEDKKTRPMTAQFNYVVSGNNKADLQRSVDDRQSNTTPQQNDWVTKDRRSRL